MKVFDLSQQVAFPFEQREKNVLHETGEFKARIIELLPGGRVPECEMTSHVIFLVLEGRVQMRVNSEEVTLREKHCLITEPATLSMETETGARLLGIQVAKA
jgi:mannose-6-phosphate isomerase-like protein (cupin superfamily)